MKHFFPTILITFCLLAGCAIGANAQTKSNDGPLTNAEIIKLVKAGFKEKTVILIIASRVPNFDLSPDRMIQLKHAGVSENIIVAMLARQEGNDVPTDDQSWGDDPFFNSKLELVEAGFSEGTIIRRIEQSPVDFDLKADKLEALRKHRVSDKVIDAMKAAMGEDK